jgi:hypothetical protein
LIAFVCIGRITVKFAVAQQAGRFRGEADIDFGALRHRSSAWVMSAATPLPRQRFRRLCFSIAILFSSHRHIEGENRSRPRRCEISL